MDRPSPQPIPLLLLLLLSGLLFFIGLGSMGLTDRDEGRNAEAGREMFASGDWVTPTFNGELRVAKPVFVYWLMTLSYHVFGVNEFAARFPSALFGVALILMHYLFLTKLRGPTVGLYGALMLLLNIEILALGRMAITDSVLIFFTTLKSNRMVSLSKEGGYIHLDEIEWAPEQLQNGMMVKLKEVPFNVRLFKVVATNGDIDWVITNSPEETLTTQAAQDASDVRWQVEELHRGLKQLTGTEKCQCRKGRSQRNHLACCYHAWLSLKVKAKELGKTLYQTKHDLLSDYLRTELQKPRIQAFLPA